MRLDDVYKIIKQSAKLQFGSEWFEFENMCINYSGVEWGTRIADELLFIALEEFSFGKKNDKVSKALNNHLFVYALLVDNIEEFSTIVNSKCKTEIDSFSLCRELYNTGLSIEYIYYFLKPSLLPLSKPIEEEQQVIFNHLLPPIINSGKARFDYNKFLKMAIDEEPTKGEQYLELVFKHILVLLSEFDFIPRPFDDEHITDDSEIIIRLLKERTLYPHWLRDLVNTTLANCICEKCALNTMRIGLLLGMSIGELEQLINTRLNEE